MAHYTNILRLCAVLSPHQIRNYMHANGWKVDAQQREGALFFEKKGDADDVYRFWIWSTRDHPKFFSRIQDLLFLLSGVEDREPLEIGNAIIEQADTLPTSSSGNDVRIRIRNVREVAMDCKVEGSQLGQHELTPGESVELAFRSGEHYCPEIIMNANSLEVRGGVADRVQVFQSAPLELNPFSFELTVQEELARGGIAVDTLSCLLLDLKSVLTRADFELNSGGAAVPAEQEAIRRQTAIVVTALAKRLSDMEMAAFIVWRTTVRIMATGNLQMELIPNGISELFRVARKDDEVAPTKTTNWLKENSQNVSSDVSRVSHDG